MKKNHNPRIIFRADGNASIGLGHVFRLLSLVELCKDKYDCLFVISQPEENIAALIRSFCNIYVVQENNEPAQLSKVLHSADIVIIDGYHFDAEYQKSIKTMAYKLIAIDDKADNHFYADLVINHGGEFVKDKYSKEPYTKVLTGFDYAILRKEFLSVASKQKKVSKVDTVFICMGGADPFKITVKALQACSNCHFIKKIIVVTGGAFSHKTELLSLIHEASAVKEVFHEESINAERMVQLIEQSEIAICPASTVAVEVCCVKAGLLSGTVIDNQAGIHQQLVEAECCISVGDFNKASVQDIRQHVELLSDISTVNQMIQRQSSAIDGFSGERILNEFKKLAV